METKEMLTIQEIEQLCQAYLDCRLSRLQEKELELILLCSDHTTPIITEARSLMGLSTLIAHSNANTIKRTGHRVLRYAGIAACVATIAISAVYCFMIPQTEVREQNVYVCVDGKELTGYVAQTVINDTEEETMNMFRSIIKDAENEQRLSEQYMNDIIE
ncbi:MAG: hypothetical protein NC405_04410 [Odoribacter sp.]|nr:hypothetical protein [Odoribacter sp.]